jgi:hypothetical protein
MIGCLALGQEQEEARHDHDGEEEVTPLFAHRPLLTDNLLAKRQHVLYGP